MSGRQMIRCRWLFKEKEKELLEILQRRADIVIPERMADTLDEVLLSNDRDLAICTLDLEAALLRNVRAALESLDDGTYGICSSCDGEIPPRRLEAVPWARLCVFCQEKADYLTQQEQALNGSTAVRLVA